MFKKLKHWVALVAASLGIYQVQRPATMETSPPPVLVTVRATPTPTPHLPVEVEPIAEATPTPVPTPINPNAVIAGQAPKMILGKVTGATAAETVMIQKAIDSANKILASDCFKNLVLEAKFTETNGFSNAQIWNLLVTNPMNIGAEMYDGSWKEDYIWKTMGYDIGDGVVYMNRYFVDEELTVSSLATHEAEGHGQGFHHYQVFATSIPYQFNDFIEGCAAKLGVSKQEMRFFRRVGH